LSGLAASVVFRLPGAREFFLSLPYIDASRHVVEKALEADRSIFVCTGSGEESLLTKQGEDTLVLCKRKGFIRLALSYGCDVVPIFGVGNSDLFKTYSVGIRFRMWLQKRLHVSIPIFHGRYLTPLPYKKPVTVLVGAPLTMPKPKVRGEIPDEQEVEKYLKIYIEKVKELHKNNTHGRKLQII
jgi:2-acylglycerol O-acyltransferase 2